MEQAQGQVSKLDNLVQKIGGTIAATFAIDKALSFTDDVTQMAASMQQMDNRISAAGKTSEDFVKNQKFINNTIDSLKLPLQQTTEGYSLFAAAIKNTALEGDIGNRVFLDMATGAKGANLGNEQLSRGFNALNKMISTGTVQADEFRGMLAEAIPGASAIAARAMNFKSLPEFNKAMEQGKINAVDFVTKFSAEFKKGFEDKVPNSLNSFQSKLNEMK
jgi:tape measure domain-containing protein